MIPGWRKILVMAVGGSILAAPVRLVARSQAGPADSPAAAAPMRARRVTDETGRQMDVLAKVRRIVTLAPNLTETVYALGLGGRLVGDTNECDSPPAAKAKPHVGEPQDPSLEAIVALHPDLVLASTTINRAETADALLRLGIPVYTSDPHTVRGMLDSIARMAALMGVPERGQALVADLRGRLDRVQARLADRPLVHVLFVVWEQPLITIGQNTFIADALRWAGAESVVLSRQNWPQLSLEEVVRLQPDYIVFAGNHLENASAELAGLQSRPAWRDLRAVEMGCVTDAGEQAVRPSPGLVDAIVKLARTLHPDAFGPGQGLSPSSLAAQGAAPEGATAAREGVACAR